MLRGTSQVGRAAHFNPAYWMLRLFLVIYRRVTRGWSRLREVMADRGAARLYGGEAFAQGLTHVIRQGATFDSAVGALLRQQAGRRRSALPNVYALLASPARALDLAQINRAASAALLRSATDDESHPAPAQRAAWTRRYRGLVRDETGSQVRSLLSEPAALERVMADEIDRRVREYTATLKAMQGPRARS